MTTSDWRKPFKQLKNKSAKLKKYKKHNTPKKRTTGKSLFKCSKCGNSRGHIKKYGVNMCRKCFRTLAKNIGFKKYS